MAYASSAAWSHVREAASTPWAGQYGVEQRRHRTTGETLHGDERGFAVPWHTSEILEAVGLDKTLHYTHPDLLNVGKATRLLIAAGSDQPIGAARVGATARNRPSAVRPSLDEDP